METVPPTTHLRVLSGTWVALAALTLALAWLLPNHVPPWTAFHSDLWAAVVLGCVGLAVAGLRIRVPSFPGALGISLIGCVILVAAQSKLGLIQHYGQAWVWIAYLFGAAMAYLVGVAWGGANFREPADLIFGAFIVAGLVSVGLALHQWFELPSIGPWIMQPLGPRMHANLGQANQLGTLLVVALVGLAWNVHFRRIGTWLAVPAGLFLVLGVVLTASRTAWLNQCALLILAVCFRSRAGSRPWVLPTLLALLLTSAGLALRPSVDAWGGYEGPSAVERGSTSDARLNIWHQMAAAIQMRPWTGWGAGQVYEAQMATIDHPNVFDVGALLSSAHNLILDLALWFGVPVAIVLALVVARWLLDVTRSVRDPAQVLVMAALMVLAIHSMLELPLHYAYFLLPFFLLAGALHASCRVARGGALAGWALAMGLSASLGMLAVTARDYLRVEASMYGLRFEAARVPSAYSAEPPDVWVLGQWRDFIVLSRRNPFAPATLEERRWAYATAQAEPTSRVLRNVSIMAAMAGERETAQLWLRRTCLITPAASCAAMRDAWMELGQQIDAIRAVPWPIRAGAASGT